MNDKVTIPVPHKNDGHIIVRFPPGDIEARADFVPPVGNGAPISPEYIDALIERLNLTYGVKHEEMKKTALAVNLSRRPRMDVLIAEGVPPTPPRSAYLRKNEQLEKKPPLAGENGQVDYHSCSPFIIVKKGEILAEYMPRVEGKPGTAINGAEIPVPAESGVQEHGAGHHAPVVYTPGVNTYSDSKYVYAAVQGQLVETNGVFGVSETLSIKGDVGYRTGDIHFPGNVVIDGAVQDGFKIYAGGNLAVKETFTATDVNVKGNLEVLGGIIGRGQGTVKVGGDVTARFIENCRVAARGNITIASELLNTSLYTMGELVVGSRGFIMGADIYAVHGMKCAKIGKAAGKACKIHAGIDFTVQKHIDRYTAQLRVLAAQLDQLKTLLSAAADTSGERYTNILNARNKHDAEIRRLTAVIDTFRSKLIVDEAATVTVSGEIAQGTLIEICQIALFIDAPMRSVTLRLDKTQGKIVSGPA